MTDRPTPFRRLSREVLVENSWHRYCRDRFTRTDGSEGDYFYVDMPGSCAVIPVFEDGTTALVHVDRYLLGRELWEFPIGGMQDGDDPETVARAELLEEAGLTAGRLDLVGRFAPYKGVSTEVCWFYRGTELTWAAQDLEPSEAITVHRLPFEEARARLLEQEIGDGQSLAGLMLYDHWLRSAGA